MSDKLNHVDYHWYMVRIHYRQVNRLVECFEQHKAETKNILEVYAPTRTSVRVIRDGNENQKQMFAGIVFVLATQNSLMEFMKKYALEGEVQYERKKANGEKARMCVIPEDQMREFKNYNENYADKVVVLERPYSDYAFNPKTNEPNEIVRVIDGPLAGCEGYICRFRRNKGLVFHVQDITPGNRLTVIYPNAYDLHVVRLHNAEGDRLSIDTEKARAADLVIGLLQACGYGEKTLSLFHELIDRLAVNLSLVTLCKELNRQGENTLSSLLAQVTGKEAELLINLARYEHDHPGYVRQTYHKLILRPFLTPTSGMELEADKTEAEFQHKDFTEVIRRVDITEDVYFPSRQKEEKVTTAYYAHIGMMQDRDKDSFTLFANWDDFLREYFLTAGKANEKLVTGTVQAVRDEPTKSEKLIESFRNCAPTLYKVLTDTDSAVKAVPDFKVGEDTLNAMVLTTADREQGKKELLRTCVAICKEINSTNHLAIWRRYLRGVWLHV